MFTQTQLDELRQIAEDILIGKAWDALPWDDAWRGIYPEKPAPAAIEKELEILKGMVQRMWTTGRIEEEYYNLREFPRMIHLEAAESFNLYQTMRRHLCNRSMTNEQSILDLLNSIERQAQARRADPCK